MTDAPDQVLIARFRDQQDESAFNALVERHQHEVYRMAFRIAGNHHDAHDLAQEAFVRVYRNLGAFRGDSAFKTWLYRIVMNLSLNQVQRRKRERERSVAIDDVALPVAARGLDDVLVAEQREILAGAIGRLPDRQRKTIILKVFHELKFTEVARVMKCSVGTAKANYFHAVQNLKRYMAGTPATQLTKGFEGNEVTT